MFLMNRRQYGVTRHNFGQFEYLDGSIIVGVTGCNANNGLATFTSGTSAKSLLTSAGHSTGLPPRNDGPFIQRPFISRTEIPRLSSSAGLSSVGTYLHNVGSQVAWISATSKVDSEHNHARTIMESDHNITVDGLILNSSYSLGQSTR